MAVQSQFQLQNNFTSDCYARLPNTTVDELLHNYGDSIFFNHNTVLSNQDSDLTCIAAGATSVGKKRARDDSATSTSGRIDQDLASLFYHQNLEIDSLVRAQNDRLRVSLEQARKRHCKSIISTIEQQFAKRLQEKEIEYENATRKNMELEEKIRQMQTENQIWFNVAKNNEAIATTLKASLDQVLLQNAVNFNSVKEGCGDTDGTALVADDATSCCYEGNEERGNGGDRRKMTCKVCCGEEVSVLVLPCRHLCLCKDCESKCDTCPICGVEKKASLQIFMS